ncbi:uncharacterized protein LOC104582689 isoform X3 [Brachypodium distachyon]|uniref:uncharacterized protein LOC104582689 isoform X3 n=1 Tax=Brachypodium distachyon TaxID=15368 RepID=UPI00052FF4B2|nr:uncharacterized protein LOC104582689 isoform X3 [Brachypodium distachyon]|eukprot:XP_010231478.1 uncharacterized protein LOC104582689 isoform X3 [Brachypodium distachyon]
MVQMWLESSIPTPDMLWTFPMLKPWMREMDEKMDGSKDGGAHCYTLFFLVWDEQGTSRGTAATRRWLPSCRHRRLPSARALRLRAGGYPSHGTQHGHMGMGSYHTGHHQHGGGIYGGGKHKGSGMFGGKHGRKWK